MTKISEEAINNLVAKNFFEDPLLDKEAPPKRIF